MSGSQKTGAKTSKTPEKADSQKQQKKKKGNSGNPVFTFTPKVLELELKPRRMNPLYKTSNGTYGLYTTTFEGGRRVYYPKTDRFSEHLRTIGMHRNTSFVTSMKKSRVCDTTLQHTLLMEDS